VLNYLSGNEAKSVTVVPVESAVVSRREARPTQTFSVSTISLYLARRGFSAKPYR